MTPQEEIKKRLEFDLKRSIKLDKIIKGELDINEYRKEVQTKIHNLGNLCVKNSDTLDQAVKQHKNK